MTWQRASPRPSRRKVARSRVNLLYKAFILIELDICLWIGYELCFGGCPEKENRWGNQNHPTSLCGVQIQTVRFFENPASPKVVLWSRHYAHLSHQNFASTAPFLEFLDALERGCSRLSNAYKNAKNRAVLAKLEPKESGVFFKLWNTLYILLEFYHRIWLFQV